MKVLFSNWGYLLSCYYSYLGGHVAPLVSYKYHVNFGGTLLYLRLRAVSVPKHEVCLRAVMIRVPTRGKK